MLMATTLDLVQQKVMMRSEKYSARYLIRKRESAKENTICRFRKYLTDIQRPGGTEKP